MSIINICINNVNREYYLEEGSSGIVLENIVKDIESEYKGYITLANINNKLRELSYKVKEDCNIKFIDTTNADGSRVYSRTMSFIFIMACNELFDKARVTIEHSLSRGLYCEVHTNKILTEYKSGIESSNFKIHQILTLASMVESEGVSLEDRKNIAGVFINRLNKNMALGSDVTTYYASKIELGERDLYVSEINSDNPYNTRSAKNAGKLPVGPICNPSKGAIEAVISYTPNDYLYFVADKNMKVYFTKTDAEHNKKIQELKKQGLWFEY